MRDRPLRVMISSTTLDLPEHREQAMKACLRVDCFPHMMETLPSDPLPGLNVSLAMVDKVDVYVLILGVRYGEVPAGYVKSITEMEYERALVRRIPILTFLATDHRQFQREQIESGQAAEKLDVFRKRVKEKHTFCYFSSPHELGLLVVDALTRQRGRETARADDVHCVSEIPEPPEPYIAHPYALLESAKVVGRRRELAELTDWARGTTAELSSIRIMTIVAIGGMGKSALTWKWFSETVAADTHLFAGRVWWSFYESDATFENFVIRALAHVRRMRREDVLEISVAEREQQLLESLNREPFLICLDGLERLMVAYAKYDAASRVEDPSTDEADHQKRHRRQTIDPRAGRFLKKLRHIKASRILITTRLYPADLQEGTGWELELPGCRAIFLQGLEEEDAPALWQTFGVHGDRDALLSVFRAVHQYPLLVRTLAGQVAHFRSAPRDFDAWLAENPEFDPFTLPLIQDATQHILQFALDALPSRARFVLMTLAPFRMPVPYRMLESLFVGGGGALDRASELHDALSELEERGLVGWDRRGNRYDLHPVVRSATWQRLHDAGRDIVHETVHAHLASSPDVIAVRARSLDELTPALEFYRTRIALGRHDAAFAYFSEQLDGPLLDRMNRFRLGAQLLEMLFPDGIEHASRLADPGNAELAQAGLAYCYDSMGEFSRGLKIWRWMSEKKPMALPALQYYGKSLVAMGHLREAEEAFSLCVKGNTDSPYERALYRSQLGKVASLIGDVERAGSLLAGAMDTFAGFEALVHPSDFIPLTNMFWYAVSQSRLEEARLLARRALNLSESTNVVQIEIEALTMQGWSEMLDGAYRDAEKRFFEAMKIAGEIGSKSEANLTIALAEVCHREGAHEGVGQLLADVWEPLQRGPRRLLHADAANLLAESELALGKITEAAEAAATAYRLALCDGAPYCYASAIERARRVLATCGASEPLFIVED